MGRRDTASSSHNLWSVTSSHLLLKVFSSICCSCEWSVRTKMQLLMSAPRPMEFGKKNCAFPGRGRWSEKQKEFFISPTIYFQGNSLQCSLVGGNMCPNGKTNRSLNSIIPNSISLPNANSAHWNVGASSAIEWNSASFFVFFIIQMFSECREKKNISEIHQFSFRGLSPSSMTYWYQWSTSPRSINWCLVALHGFYRVVQTLLFLVSFLHTVLETEWAACSPGQNFERWELFNGPLTARITLKIKNYEIPSVQSRLLVMSKTRSRRWDNDPF